MKTKVMLFGSTGLVGMSIRNHPNLNKYMWCWTNGRGNGGINLLSETDILDYLKQHKPDFVIHAAGKVGGINANMKNQYGFLYENAMMGLAVVNAVRTYNETVGLSVKLLNLASSCMYSPEAPQPFQPKDILEGHLESTNEGYALAKILVTKAVQYLANQSPDCYKTIIPCNLYGPWDKFDPENAHLVPAIISKMDEAKKAGKKHIEVWGTGEARREFMYSADLADFVFFALDNWKKIPSIMNVGVGHDHSVREYYEAVADVLGIKVELVFDKTKPTGVYSKLCDVSIQKELGWMPKTDLRTGILETYRGIYFRKYGTEP